MTNSNEPPRRPARRQPTRRSTAPRTSVPSARDELERERELYSQHDPTASFMHERVQNKPAGQERGASAAFPAYAGAGNDHIAHSRVAMNESARASQRPAANGSTPNVSAWDQHSSAGVSQRLPRVEGQRPSASASQRMPRVEGQRTNMQGSQRMPRVEGQRPNAASVSSTPFAAVPPLRSPARACALRQRSRSKVSLRSRYP